MREKDIFKKYEKYIRPYDSSMDGKDFLNLSRIKLLFKKLGNPEKKLVGIQVAGTKGKGSTTAFLQQILVEAGYKTGSFFSPYIMYPSERIMINGKNISNSRVIQIADRMIPMLMKVEKESGIQVSFFEFMTALAVMYFVEEKVDIVVMEVGLGGRLDATTAIGLRNKIITNISYDHTKSLGNTITKIAGEKAAIIGKNNSVVTSTKGRALSVVKNKVKRTKSEIMVVGKDINYKINKIDLTGTNINVYYEKEKLNNVELSLIGRHQAENFMCAFGMARLLQKEGYKISLENIRRAGKNTNHQARFQIYFKTPLLILDGAHNLYSIRALINTLRDIGIESRKAVFVFAAKKTKKQIPEIIRTLASFSKEIIFPEVANNPNLQDYHSAERLKKIYKKGVVSLSLKEGIKDAKKISGKQGVIIVTGSLYVIGEILKNKNEAAAKRC